jgi:hypothetical protein
MKRKPIRRTLAGLLVLLLLFALPALGEGGDIPAAKGDEPAAIRVMLTRLAAPQRLDITLNGLYSAQLGETELVFGRGADIAVLLIDGRMYLYYADMRIDAGTALTLARHPAEDGLENGLRFANNAAVYEGDLRLTVADGKMRPLLTIAIEDYVKGVVPYEMSESFPLEALKAQAVAARTYAVSMAALRQGKEYDVVDNTNDQVYRGRRAEYAQAALAVDDTQGVCGFYKGKLAMCYYSASNGGQTELKQHVWNTEADGGYLDMRDDPYDLANPQSKVQSVTLPKKADTVDAAPYALRLLLATQLKDTLAAGGFDTAPESLLVSRVTAVSIDTPMYDAPSKLYTRLHITFEYSARTRTDPPATQAPAAPQTVADGDADVSLFTAEPVQAGDAAATPSPTPAPTPVPTPVPSYGPFVKADKPVTLDIPYFPDAEKLLSLGINTDDNEIVTVTETDSSFVIEARRFGHGVGLSQRGAEWMAGQHGMTYQEILAFYYPGMALMRYAAPADALPTLAAPLTQTAGPVPTPTPRPTLMPVAQALPAGAWYAQVTGIDDDSTLNLRAAPDASAEVLMRLYKGQKLIVLEECPQEDWVKVRTDAVEGYVMEKFLTQEQ